ncbi:hypothetical protein QJS10_CPA01g00995 [Acorus calamus]|uniref:PGG domain-containing protein n=1 Tax=Acorus calamus TaxID=4465 RepID=A0AAV9FKQ4_ACOCL|nr:hypothetical protein QJS10_CPA01g00995 [Acorus calamus]
MVEPMLEYDDAAPDDIQSIAYHGNDDGHTPLHVAAAYGCKSMVKAIVDRHPGCVTLTDNQGRTALHVAVQAHQKAVVKHILKHCEFAGLINDRDIDGNSPLHLAALNHNHEMVSILLSTWVRHKPDTNPMNNAGQTPRDILDPVNFPEIFLGHFKRIFEVYAGIKCPRSILFTEAGGKHGPRLCDLPNKLNQSGERRAAATEKPKANGSNGLSDNKEAAVVGADDGGKGKAKMVEKLASNLMLAATLIITVTFAAIITMPGGFESDQNNTTNNNGYKGTAVLARRLAFQVFVLTDTLAFLLSFRAALRLIWTALMNGVDLLIDDVRFAQWMVQAALVAMTLAFGTGAYSVLERHCNWIAEVVLVVVCFFSLSPFMELVPSILGKCQEALRALLPTLRLTYKTIEYLCWENVLRHHHEC